MSELEILSRNLETGDIITHTDDGGSYSEAYFLGWGEKLLATLPANGGNHSDLE